MASNRIDTELQGITDLTVLARIKPGFVPGFESISHADRLQRVLKTLNALRQAARESPTPLPTGFEPFTDVVSRFRIVHSFRFAILPAEPGGAQKLLLNVNFDGGWEPYMRVIWRDLGAMLDLIFCHCEDYPLAREHDFPTYQAWVRANEVTSDFLFIESGRSVADQQYLEQLEALQRQQASPGAVDVAAAQLALPADHQARILPAIGLKPLNALFALARYFPLGSPSGHCLLRAAQDILFELRALDTRQLFPAGHPLRQRYFQALAWFESDPAIPAPKPERLKFEPQQIQAGLLTPYPEVSHGCLVLLRVANRAKALAWLAAWQPSIEGQPAADGIHRQVALSCDGLRALGLPDARLARFPQAFREGMAGRAGVLGDLRHNHPDRWTLPPLNWPPQQSADGRPALRVNLSSVHLLVQLRTLAAADEASPDPQALLPRLQAEVGRLEADSGWQVLSVQALRRNQPTLPLAEGLSQEHFGFADGISQPRADGAATPGQYWSDAVQRGELLQGYASCRDSGPVPAEPDLLLDNGSFMVVRKLRQFVERLNTALAGQPADARDKMMGRSPAGEPLASPRGPGLNDFNFKADPGGALCPVHAHVRRANPRTLPEPAGQPVDLPRIFRRGMSYGPRFEDAPSDAVERGLMFMAYNANLSEQFETVQRWIAGGNSSGGYSGQSDPFLGVAPASGTRIYRYLDAQGAVVRIDLGAQPFVTLEWGAYFFVPSIAALRALPALAELQAAAPPTQPPVLPAVDDADGWRQWLEDPNRRDAAWARVRAQPGGVLRTAYGVLVGDAAQVMTVFRDAQQRYSVCGYGERMAHSVGRGFLGMDEDSGHATQAPAVNRAIEAIGEAESFEAAFALTTQHLQALEAGARALHSDEVQLDLERIGETVLAGLCTRWFGLPDGRLMWGPDQPAPQPGAAGTDSPPPRCPHHFMTVSRYVFGPSPNANVVAAAQSEGQALLKAVRQYLAGKPVLTPLTQQIVDALATEARFDADLIPRTLTGVMLGFPPTVQGNLISSLAAWVSVKKLWDLQLDLRLQNAATPLQRAQGALRAPLLATMMARPVPAMVWRTVRHAHTLGAVALQPGDKLIVGISSASQHNPGEHHQMFGGDRFDAVQPAAPHACSGYGMAMGVMQGVIAALLESGPLRATPSPTVLIRPL